MFFLVSSSFAAKNFQFPFKIFQSFLSPSITPWQSFRSLAHTQNDSAVMENINNGKIDGPILKMDFHFIAAVFKEGGAGGKGYF